MSCVEEDDDGSLWASLAYVSHDADQRHTALSIHSSLEFDIYAD